MWGIISRQIWDEVEELIDWLIGNDNHYMELNQNGRNIGPTRGVLNVKGMKPKFREIWPIDI